MNDNGTVTARNLSNEVCLDLINRIHGKIYFSRRMYCNGVIPITPLKETESSVASTSNINKESPENNPEIFISEAEKNPGVSSPLKSTTSWPQIEAKDLARRYSLSLIDRTPPPKSLAADLLSLDIPKFSSKSLMSSIKDLTETLSDFNSCISSTSADDSGDETKSARKQKKKRRAAPDKQ